MISLSEIGHEERIGLRRLIDARRREQIASIGGPCAFEGLLHGSAIVWPPPAMRRPREMRLPTLDEYEHASRA